MFFWQTQWNNVKTAQVSDNPCIANLTYYALMSATFIFYIHYHSHRDRFMDCWNVVFRLLWHSKYTVLIYFDSVRHMTITVKFLY